MDDMYSEKSVFEEVHELIDELKKLAQSKEELVKDNVVLKEKLRTLTGEADGLDVIIKRSKEELQRVESTVEGYGGAIAGLQSKKERLIEEINRYKGNIKIVEEDLQNTAGVKTHLMDELAQARDDKEIVVTRFREIQNVMNSIERKKKLIMPKFSEYDVVLKQIHKAFKEVESKVSLSKIVHNYHIN